MNVHQSPLPVLIVAIPLIAAFVLPVLGWLKQKTAFPLVLFTLVCVFGMSIIVSMEVLRHGPMEYFMGGWTPPWGIEYHIDHLGSLMLLMVSFVTLLVGIYSNKSVLRELPDKAVPFYSVYLLLVSGLMGIVVTADMFNLYVFLEISSLASYALIAIGGGTAVVSAFRYVILGTIGAAFYLLSVGYLYSVTGSLNMNDLAILLADLDRSNAVLVSFAFFVIGISIKMALFPMHTWLPNAYSDAPSAVSALLAGTTTKVAAYILVRVTFFVFQPNLSIELIPITTLLSWMGAIAMLLGSVMTITQSDLKRMLAYSSVAQVGYIVMGVSLANTMSLTGGLLHLVGHAFMKGGLFLVAGGIIYQTGIRKIRDLRFLSIKMPWTAATFAVIACSLIGIPPTVGFFSKMYLILGAIDAEQWLFVTIIFVSSVLALMYFANVIRYMYFPKEDDALDTLSEQTQLNRPTRNEVPLTMLAPMLSLAVIIVLLGLFNGQVLSLFIEPAVTASIVR